ncbi:hypothetical protein OSB04_024508 [Centaurea solstitialis]|uniref:BHLH domain-containing protein n=1 Tax=Centaurea solstitialis TaxID=347529 RepID=A0AA38SZL9_9ASTR|nr:hypothetical protein OSB04_024508 [Centaurea solstitialis]
MALPFYSSNWPTFRQQPHHATAVPPPPPPPELLPFHDNFTSSINPMLEFNHHFSTFNNNLSFSNNNTNIKYPSLSSSYNPLITTQHQHLLYDDQPLTHLTHFSNFAPDWEMDQWPVCDPMVQLQPELLPPLPEVYQDYGVDTVMAPPAYYEGGGGGGGVMEVVERSEVEVKKVDGGGGGRSLSAQSVAARVRRRKISQKTMELGKLVPGGHRMSTAEMFQAALKYIKFLQAQVGVLQLIKASSAVIRHLLYGPSEELEALVNSPSVQEKLYSAEKCIVPQGLEETLVHDHQINDLLTI